MAAGPSQERALGRATRRARARRAALLALLAGGLASAAAGPAAAPAPVPAVGPAPLAAQAGGVVLLHVWATWCAPCLRELPALTDFYRGPYAGLAVRGLRLVTVSQDVRDADLRDYLAEHAPPFPVYRDSLGEVSDRLGLRGLPATVVLDARGEVIERMLGSQPWRSEGFVAHLEQFLTE